VVQAGIMKINVHISNLKLVDEQKIVLNNSGIGKIGMSKAKSISTEIDVRDTTWKRPLKVSTSIWMMLIFRAYGGIYYSRQGNRSTQKWHTEIFKIRFQG